MQIHELNNFSGTLGAGSYLAVDDGSDTGKLSTQQLLSSTEARIDNLVSSVTVDSEVIDARYGADGVTYTSLGKAIRTQISDLKDDLIDPNLKNYTWVDYKYANANTGEIVSNNSYSYFKAQINKYPVLHIKTNIASVVGICFYDVNDVFISGIGDTSGNPFDEIVEVPKNAYYIIVSSLKSKKSEAGIWTTPKEIMSALVDTIDLKASLPDAKVAVSYTLNNGIISKTLSVYTQGDDYHGRYTAISVSQGERYSVSGKSTSATYPCAFVTLNGSFVSEILGGSSAYENTEIVIPSGVDTLYINGFTNSQNVDVKKLIKLTQSQFDDFFSNSDTNAPLKAVYKNSILYVKKKYDSTKDICLSFGNVGGNSLFNFRSAFYISNTDGKPNNNFTDADAINTWTMVGSDWIGPYIVSADSNADGDNPTSEYFTGGNHRTTNTGTGGGVTAVQNSLTILIDGITTMQSNTIYNCHSVNVVWSNDVQAYNTSKSDGSGRAVLKETWEMDIDKDSVKAHNTIKAYEAIKIKTYYGLQATCSGKSYRFIGGNNRNTYVIGTDTVNSGNNDCRKAELWDSNFDLTISVNPIDLGLFQNNNGNSFITSSTKLYSYLIGSNHIVSLANGDMCDVYGEYAFK